MKNSITKLKIFYDSLTKEKETFTLPFSEMLQHKLIITKEESGRIIGVAGIIKHNELFVVVKDECQDRKTGQELVRKVFEKARNRNFSYISLSVFDSNSKAIHVFSKLGFRTVGTSSVNGQRFRVMILHISWPASFYRCVLYIELKLLSIIRLRQLAKAFNFGQALRDLIRAKRE